MSVRCGQSAEVQQLGASIGILNESLDAFLIQLGQSGPDQILQ